MFKGIKKTPLERILGILFSGIILAIIYFTGLDAMDKPNNVFSMANEINNMDENIEPQKELYTVTRVIDGDTLEIYYNGTKESVRLIGIDTPESVHPDESKNTEQGRIASEYTKSLLEDRGVYLEFDVEKRDQYGRLLAYVYLDDEMINKKLLEEGYAQLATYPPNVKYVEEFTEIQKQAREAEKGFWAEDIF